MTLFYLLDLSKILQNCFFSYDKNRIEFTGLQAGEKLTEVLFIADEASELEKLDGVFVIKNRDDSLLQKSEMALLFSGDIDFLYKKIKDFR